MKQEGEDMPKKRTLGLYIRDVSSAQIKYKYCIIGASGLGKPIDLLTRTR